MTTPQTPEWQQWQDEAPDYEYLGRCQFPGGYQGPDGQEADCGEYAIALGRRGVLKDGADHFGGAVSRVRVRGQRPMKEHGA